MSVRITSRSFEYLVGSAIALVAFVVYAFTLCPTVNFIDSGELAAVTSTLGIAHPTGYPLFTLVGWVFVHLPLGLRPILQLNLLAAVLCLLGVFFFFRFLMAFLATFVSDEKRWAVRSTSVNSQTIVREIIPSVVGSLILAFSETYWSQALSIEVYSLHVLFLSALLFLVTKAVRSESSDTPEGAQAGRRYWFAFAFILGLSFTNHMTTILLAPALLYLYFSVRGFSERVWKQTLLLALPFLAGFSVQLYLPIRASQDPIFNWGNPIDLERWFWHFSGKVYRVWIFSSTESAAKQLSYFVYTVGEEFAYFPLALAVVGLVSFLRRRRVAAIFTLLLFFCCVLYAINYDIHDIDAYFLLAYITIAVWFTVGVYQIVELAQRRVVQRIVAVAFLLSCAVLVFHNYDRVDETNNHLVEQYTKDVLNSIEPDGIVISYQWDYFVSASYYFQIVEKLRTDVVVIDKELLRRSWYFEQLSQRYPWLIARSKKEVDLFLVELDKFEHNAPYNPNLIELRYANLIRSFIEQNNTDRPVYVTHEIEPQYTPGYQRVPSGLVFRLYSDSVLHAVPPVAFNPGVPTKRDKYVEGILAQYAQAYTNNALYLISAIGKPTEAIAYLEQALRILPNFVQAQYLRDRIVAEHSARK